MRSIFPTIYIYNINPAKSPTMASRPAALPCVRTAALAAALVVAEDEAPVDVPEGAAAFEVAKPLWVALAAPPAAPVEEAVELPLAMALAWKAAKVLVAVGLTAKTIPASQWLAGLV